MQIELPEIGEFDVPVLIICFNRPRYIAEQLRCIRLVKPKKVYIACDGPRSRPGDLEKVSAVRTAFLDGIDWDCKLVTNFSEVNQGCGFGPINAMKWFFTHEREGIVLEDDIMPSVDFFRYSSVMLDLFRDNPTVISVSGCNLGYDTNPSSVFLSKMMNMWGWATWADRFELIDFEMHAWNSVRCKRLYLLRRLAIGPLDFDFGWADFWRVIFERQAGPEKLDAWDYQFIFNQITSGKLTVFPGKNLIRNIGFDSDATHTDHQEHFMIGLEAGGINWPLQVDPEATNPDPVFYEEYIKQKWSFYRRPNWKFYVGNLLRKLTFQSRR
jgi:hypothetical protein